MKYILPALCAVILAPALAAACPDFSGTYVEHFPAEDYRQESEFRLTQTGCEQLHFDHYLTRFREGRPHESKLERTEITDGQMRGGPAMLMHSFQWKGEALESLYLDVNSEHCAERAVWEQDEKKNLRVRWRFECPGDVPDQQPWVTGEFYERKN